MVKSSVLGIWQPRCWRFDNKSGQFLQVRWMDVRVGDILLNFADEAFAADVLLVRAAGGQVHCLRVK